MAKLCYYSVFGIKIPRTKREIMLHVMSLNFILLCKCSYYVMYAPIRSAVCRGVGSLHSCSWSVTFPHLYRWLTWLCHEQSSTFYGWLFDIRYLDIHNPQDQLALQKDLDILEQWANKWGMQFNPGKCNILSISRSTPLQRFYSLFGTALQNVHEARYLGINMSDDFQWGSHIRSIADKSSSTLGLLKRNLSKCPQKLREQAYISLIRSRLEYCAAVWDPYLIKDINILDGIQRRAARFVIQDHSRFNSLSSLLKDLNWAPLKDRRRDNRQAMLFKIVKCNMPVQVDTILLTVDPRTRHHYTFKFRHILSHAAQYKHSVL